MPTRINGVTAHSGSVILPTAKDYAEITVNDTNFKLRFEDDGGKLSSEIEKKDETIIFIFKNLTDPLGTVFSSELPLISGGYTEMQFLIYTIGKGSERSALIHYTYRDMKK